MKNGDKLKLEKFKVYFNGEESTWYLTVFPNGRRQEDAGHISVYLQKDQSKDDVIMKVSLGLSISGRNIKHQWTEQILLFDQVARGFPKFVSHLWLLDKPGSKDSLTLSLTMMVLSCKPRAPVAVEKSPKTAKLLADVKSLLDTGELSDCLIKCGGKEFKCHKTILALRSKVFKVYKQGRI